MEQKRHPFRFRIPWKSESSIPHPADTSSSSHTKKKPKLPFYPPGIAPIKKIKSPSSSIADQTNMPSTSQNQHMNLMQNPKLEENKQPDAPEIVETRVMFSTSNPTNKDTKILSSTNPKVSNVLTPNTSKHSLQNEIKEDVSSCDHQLATENPFNVTTLAGDNRGATMNIGSKSGKKEILIPICRAYKKNPELTKVKGDESSDEDLCNTVENEVGNAYVNSNIQSLNNSLMCQSSINDRDPGVHVTLPEKHVEVVKRDGDDKRGKEIRKAEVNDGVRIRRRCLRGLMAEPSDSDPDNPNKPQRHGCKFKCGEVPKF